MSQAATSYSAEMSNLGQPQPPGRSQPKALSNRGACARTWYFTFDLQSIEAGVASQLKAFKSSQFRESNLKAQSSISYSFTNGSPDTRGFTSGGSRWQKSVQTWLTHSGSSISNLQLHPTSDRFNDPRIRSFLEESNLPDAGGSAMPGRRLRQDTSFTTARARGGWCEVLQAGQKMAPQRQA